MVLSGFRPETHRSLRIHCLSAGPRTPFRRGSRRGCRSLWFGAATVNTRSRGLFVRPFVHPLPIHAPLAAVEAFGAAEDDSVVGVPGKHPGVVYDAGAAGVGRAVGASAFRAAGRGYVGGGASFDVAAGVLLPGGRAGLLGPSVGLAVGVFCLVLWDLSLTAALLRVARRLPVFACLASLPRGFPPLGV